MKKIILLVLILFSVSYIGAQPNIKIKLSVEKDNNKIWVHTTIINVSNHAITLPILAKIGVSGDIIGQSPSWITLDAWTKSGIEINDEKNIIYCYIGLEENNPFVRLKKGESFTNITPLENYAEVQAQGFFIGQVPEINSIQVKVHLAYFCYDCEQKENVEDILSNRVIIE